MATVESSLQVTAESVFDIGGRLAGLLQHARQESAGGKIPESVLVRLADTVEALRSHLVRKAERDPRSLFDLDDRLVELLERADEATADGRIPQEMIEEIQDYLSAFQTKVDRIASYWRWQESIATICVEEAERLTARKRAAERRVNRLRDMLLTFMMSRGLKRLDGEKAAIGLQANSAASLVIDDPLQIDERFFERSLRLSKTEVQEIVCQMADGKLRSRLAGALTTDGWEINGAAVRFAVTNNSPVPGARLVKGQHVRLR